MQPYCVYVVGLPQVGGAWLATGRAWLQPDVPHEEVKKYRAKGCTDQLFCLEIQDRVNFADVVW